jgi:hypothetical protein
MARRKRKIVSPEEFYSTEYPNELPPYETGIKGYQL